MASILKVNTIQDATNSNTAMTIDSSGRVLQPSVPAFRVGFGSNQTISSTGNNTLEWDKGISSESESCYSQGGFSWSSGVVTVPVAGIYHFSITLRIDSIGSGYLVAKILKNDSESGTDDMYLIDGSPASDYTNLTGSNVYKCSANDNIRIKVASSADSSYTVTNNSIFSGHFVG
jgi:hypothetical protein